MARRAGASRCAGCSSSTSSRASAAYFDPVARSARTSPASATPAIPLAVLMLSLRRWRPLPVALGRARARRLLEPDPDRGQLSSRGAATRLRPAYWAPAICVPARRTSRPRTASRRWTRPATGRPSTSRRPRSRSRAVASARDDFPQNELLYDELVPAGYLAWLRGLGVRYVVLTKAPSDYSARDEAALLRSGHSGLRPVLRTTNLTVLEVPNPRPILTGPAPARVLQLTGTRIGRRPASRGRLSPRGSLLALLGSRAAPA